MKLVVFLNGERGARVLEAIRNAGHDVLRTVKNDEPVNQPAFADTIRSLKPDILVVAGFSQILKPHLFELARYGAINLHAGKLPKYRGGSPLNWQIINGETEAGLSVIRMDEGVDTGPLLASKTIPIVEGATTVKHLHDVANNLFPEMTIDVLRKIETRTILEVPQPSQGAEYWHQRNDNDGHIRWAGMTAIEVDRFVRALTRPYPGAWTLHYQRMIRIFSVRIPERSIRGNPGRVCHIGGKLYVVCKDRAVEIVDHEGEAHETGAFSEVMRRGAVLT